MAHVRKAEGMSKRFKDWVQNIGPFLRLRDVLFELLTEIIFQLYHQIANVLFHYTIALSNWNFFQNNSETKLKTSEMKCKIDSSHWKENGGRAPPRGHFHGQIFSGLLQWCSHVESNAMVWNSFLILGLSSTTELKTIDPWIPRLDSVKVMHLGSTKHLQHDGLKKLPFVHILICWIILVPRI